MGVAQKIELQDDMARFVDGIGKVQNQSPSEVINIALAHYWDELQDKLEAEEADRILNDPSTEWETLEELKADLGI